MANVQKDLGPVSAYAIAVKHGYQGTEEEWAALQIAAAENAAAAAQSAKAAADTLASVEKTVNQEAAQAVQAVEAQEAASIESVEAAASAAGAAQEAAIAAKGAETLESIPSEYAALAEQVNQNTADLLTKAPAIECEASGSLVTVTDAAAQPAVQLVTHIEPVQEGEGDPSPDNVRPISGWDKAQAQRVQKNVADASPGRVHSGYYTDSIGAESTANANFIRVAPIAVMPNTTYTISSNLDLYSIWSAKDGERLSKKNFNPGVYTTTYTTVDNQTQMLISLRNTSGAADTTAFAWLQVELGTEATAYELYQGQTLTADLPETVYGGTLDWGTGMLTVDRASIDMGAINWAFNQVATSVWYFAATINNLQGCTDPAEYADFVCEKYKVSTQDTWRINPYSICGQATGSINRILVHDPDYADVNAFQSAVSGYKLVYRLITPYTIQLTPQQLEMLRGTNNLWSDTGDTDLVYVADTKSYIDNKIAAIAAAIVNG